jgi:hypothetical protein
VTPIPLCVLAPPSGGSTVQKTTNVSALRALAFKARGLPSSALARNHAGSVAVLQFRSVEILCARSADPLIAHDFEAESLALI